MDFICQFFDFFIHEYTLVFIILAGSLTRFRHVFLQAAALLLFSIIFNTYLKSIWQIPLLPHLNKQGWSFPSGHMQSAVVFWGWLWLQTRSFFCKSLILTLVAGIAASILHFNYHPLQDILAGVSFGLLVILPACLLHFFSRKTEMVAGLCTIVALGIILKYPYGTLNLWSPEGALAGLTLGAFKTKHHPPLNFDKHLYALIFKGILGSTLLYYVFQLSLPLDPQLKNFIKYFLFALWISWGIFLPWKKSQREAYA